MRRLDPSELARLKEIDGILDPLKFSLEDKDAQSRAVIVLDNMCRVGLGWRIPPSTPGMEKLRKLFKSALIAVESGNSASIKGASSMLTEYTLSLFGIEKKDGRSGKPILFL